LPITYLHWTACDHKTSSTSINYSRTVSSYQVAVHPSKFGQLAIYQDYLGLILAAYLPRMGHHQHLHRRQHGGDHSSPPISNRDSKDMKPEQGSPKVATVVSVVYVTAAPTFNGPIGGYTTLAPVGAPVQASSADSPPFKPAPSSSAAETPSAVIAPPSSQPTMAQSNILASTDPSSVSFASAPSSSVAVDLSMVPSSSIAIDSSVLSSAASSTSPLTTPVQLSSSSLLATSSDINVSSSFAAASATASPSASPTKNSDTTGGSMSGGAKVGLALGLLLGLGAVLALVLLCYGRKKKQNTSYEKTDDEKGAFDRDLITFGAGRPSSIGTTRTSATAPRLSLRPVTQFYPDLGGRRKSGNLLAFTPAVEGAPDSSLDPAAAELPSSSENQGRHSPGSPSGSSDPFGDHAENPAPAPQAVESSQAASRHPDIQAAGPGIVKNLPSKDIAVAGGAVAAGVLASHQHASKPLYINSNLASRTAPVPSPAGTEFSVNSITPDAATASSPQSSNVHRVQLDFRPSMDDELELRAGQLVRLLHEYDDGWVSRSSLP